MNDEGIVIIDTAHHRNGCSGRGFTVVKFTAESNDGREMLAVVFDTDDGVREELGCSTAVFDSALLSQGVIEFGINSWRGDNYDQELRAQLKQRESSKWNAWYTDILLGKEVNA